MSSDIYIHPFLEVGAVGCFLLMIVSSKNGVSTDIVSKESRARFEDFDKSRTMELDMDEYRELLVGGIKELAYFRTLDRLRPREDDDDGEYCPSLEEDDGGGR